MNYFLNARWLSVQTPRRNNLTFTDIRLSSQFVLGGDCTQPMLYPPWFGIAKHVSDDCDKDDATQPGILFRGETGGMNVHRAGNNVLFGDCHVDSFKRFDPAAMTYSPHKMQDWASVTVQ